MNYTKGSVWRKWDLHVHTPESIIQGYGGPTTDAWEKFISNLESLPSEFKVIGINDYIFIDGYKKVLEYKAKGRLANIDLILPVIELRIDKLASLGEEPWKKINLHVIFSDNVTPEEIEAQFLNALQHSIKLSPDVVGVDFNGVATRDNIEKLGQKIKDTSPTTFPGTNLKVGFWNLTYDFKQVVEIVRNGYFKDESLVAIGKSEWDEMRWTSSPAIKKDIINQADFSFISLDKYSDYSKHSKALELQKVKNVLLDCSDAHYFTDSKEKDRIGNSFTWIKADTAFEGLKQVANDKTRIFIGDIPPLNKRVSLNKTKFIKNVNINKISGSTLDEIWFNNFELVLNPSLVAIIGNKGSGKSAITDSIGLVGNTTNYPDFSFLNDKKFRKPKPINKSEHFIATINWEDGSPDSKKLNENPNPTSVMKVQYIPQGYLEKLCNDDVKNFEKELRQVIFSHITDDERFGASDLNELIYFHTDILTTEIDDIKLDINNLNKTLSELEQKTTVRYKKIIEEQLLVKENELKVHDSAKPKPVSPPDDPEILKHNKAISEQIEHKRGALQIIDTQIFEKSSTIKVLKVEISELGKIVQSIEGFDIKYKKLIEENKDSLNKYGISIDDVIQMTVDLSRIEILVSTKTVELQKLENELNQDSTSNESGLIYQKKQIEDELIKLKEQLDDSSLKYQTYLDEQKIWEKTRIILLGDKSKEGSINYFKSIKDYLENKLSDEIKEFSRKRIELVTKLFKKKEGIIKLYKSLFRPISEFIENYGDIVDEYSINLDVDYKIDGFIEKFFDHISMSSKGSFLGNPGGVEVLTKILENHDFSIDIGVIEFLEEIIEFLKKDKRDGMNNENREIDKQLKKGYSVYDFYNYLFSLEYLQPQYKLKLGDKNISELSPGERGALLLIFYLTLDQNNIPLVIDQPEENLDNQSVFKILVKFIIEAKNNRQIIIVTHNPNLAVACNAEQVVYVQIDKKNKNEVHFTSGSLENKIINDAVIDILEGTFPALNTRTDTYKIIKRKR